MNNWRFLIEAHALITALKSNIDTSLPSKSIIIRSSSVPEESLLRVEVFIHFSAENPLSQSAVDAGITSKQEAKLARRGKTVVWPGSSWAATSFITFEVFSKPFCLIVLLNVSTQI